MTIKQTIKVLKKANKWRRSDEDMKMPDPKEFGEAIDVAVTILEYYITIEPVWRVHVKTK